MGDPLRVAFYTLGCKLNFSETSTIARQFREGTLHDGTPFTVVDFDSPADIYVINTCSVTDEADKKCRRVIRQANRTSPAKAIKTVSSPSSSAPAEEGWGE